MEATLTLDELLHHRERATVGRPLGRGGGEATLRRIEELYAGLVDAAVARDLEALRAIAARIAQEQPDAVRFGELRTAFPMIE